MDNCPFCGSAIKETLALQGGPCPHCFGDIPGEEAPTDPGEEVKAVVAAAEEAEKVRRARTPAIVMAIITTVAIGLAYWATVRGPEPVADVMVFEADYFGVDVASLGVWQEPVPEPVDETPDAEEPSGLTTQAASISPKPTVVRAADLADNTTDAVASLNASREVVEPAANRRRTAALSSSSEERRVPEMATSAKGGGDPFSATAGVGPRRRVPLLEDPEDVKAAIGSMVRGGAPHVNQCYERRLKANPSLHGTWKLQFTVEADGGVTSASTAGVDGGDQELETCITGKIQLWNLGFRLTKSQPVVFPVTLRPT